MSKHYKSREEEVMEEAKWLKVETTNLRYTFKILQNTLLTPQ